VGLLIANTLNGLPDGKLISVPPAAPPNIMQ
jgi:hypothetical protein